MLPTMKIGDHAITRLIAGSNPFTGKSHMTPEVDADMKAYFTDEQAFAMITVNAAKIAGIDSRVGSIQPGKDADMVLYDGHPFDLRSKVSMVFLEGEQVR